MKNLVKSQVKEIMQHILKPVNELFPMICGDMTFRSSNNPETKFFDFTAFMEIWGNVTGQIYLSFSKEALEKVSLKLFGIDLKEMEDEEFYFEGSKELINILTGSCKTDLKASGFDFEASLPERIDSEAANENLSFSEHETIAFSCSDLKLSINIAYYQE